MKFLLLFSVWGFSVSVFGETETPPIVYKRVSSFAWIWDDRGTGAYKGITIWRPQVIQSGYYALGDVGIPETNSPMPENSAILVKAIESDALTPPVGFTEIWRDVGSGGIKNVRFLKMEPQSGYSCLGEVAFASFGSLPDYYQNLFRCVKNEYLTTVAGTYSLMWDDKASGSIGALTLYRNLPSGSDTYALEANTLTAVGSYTRPSGSPPLLNGRIVRNHQDVNIGLTDVALNVYETTDKEMTWSDTGTGAVLGITVWRSKGKSETYSLGDIAYPRTDKDPIRGFVAKAVKTGALQAPVGFREIWRDSGAYGKLEGSFYQPLCDAGYRAIGHVSGNGYSTPPIDSVRCVKDEFTKQGDWKFVWNDKGSGGHQECSVYEAVAIDSSGQAVQAMSAVQSYAGMVSSAYVLKSDVVNFLAGKPASSYTIQNVIYHFDDRKIVNTDPESITRTTLVNKGTTEQSASRTLSYEYAEEYSWSNSAGLEVGIETTVSAGVPFIASGEVTVSASTSYSHDWGGSTSETTSDSIAVTVTVKPRSSKIAEVVGSRYTIDLPYTGTLITHYTDGTTGKRDEFTGTFRGVEVNDIRIIFQPDVSLD